MDVPVFIIENLDFFQNQKNLFRFLQIFRSILTAGVLILINLASYWLHQMLL